MITNSDAEVAKQVWESLSTADVTNHIQKKGQFSYLSWAWAWGEVKDRFPDATYEFNEWSGLDVRVYSDGSGMVECQVTIEGLTHSMWLPIMDNRNNAVKQFSARDVNDTKMRCLVKCLAMFGLGHFIYAGEDVPREPNAEPPQPITEDTAKVILNWQKKTKVFATEQLFFDWVAISLQCKFNMLSEERAQKLLEMLDAKPNVEDWHESFQRAYGKVIRKPEESTSSAAV